MSTAPEPRRMVTREMIEAHYKSVMNAALVLLSQDCVALAQNVLSEAFSRPYPTPAPAVPKAETTQLCITPSSPCSEEMSALYPEFSRGWNACLECVIAAIPEAPVIRAWIKETPSGVYLRDAKMMADIPEEWDGPTRSGWEPLYANPVLAPAAKATGTAPGGAP